MCASSGLASQRNINCFHSDSLLSEPGEFSAHVSSSENGDVIFPPAL